MDCLADLSTELPGFTSKNLTTVTNMCNTWANSPDLCDQYTRLSQFDTTTDCAYTVQSHCVVTTNTTLNQWNVSAEGWNSFLTMQGFESTLDESGLVASFEHNNTTCFNGESIEFAFDTYNSYLLREMLGLAMTVNGVDYINNELSITFADNFTPDELINEQVYNSKKSYLVKSGTGPIVYGGHCEVMLFWSPSDFCPYVSDDDSTNDDDSAFSMRKHLSFTYGMLLLLVSFSVFYMM